MPWKETAGEISQIQPRSLSDPKCTFGTLQGPKGTVFSYKKGSERGTKIRIRIVSNLPDVHNAIQDSPIP